MGAAIVVHDPSVHEGPIQITRSNIMKNSTKTISGLRVKTSIKAGGLRERNHNISGLRVKTSIKAGGLRERNHNISLVRAG